VTLLSTLLTLMYFWRLIQRMYFHEPAAGTPAAGDVLGTETVPDGGADGTDRDPAAGDWEPAIDAPSVGMTAVVVSAAIAAVALGFAAPAIEQFLEPTLQTLLTP
jgi:multicomponent Na+:H+ antiporter subunit D